MSFHHVPVLKDEVLRFLSPVSGGVYADGTLGGGGHSEEILKSMAGQGLLYGIDRDREALKAAGERLQEYADFVPLYGNFHDVKALLPAGTRLSGGLLDLGVSSHQLDTKERGFSYHEDAPLDMRMDGSCGPTAAEWLNSVDEETFRDALYQYSDEKWAARIAKMLIEKRAENPLATTFDLVRVVDAAIPKNIRRKNLGHPARRTFQAVRIAVNDEIAPLRKALNDWVDLLLPGGRLCVITFHSIEDRLVKQAFQTLRNPCTCPPKAPVCTCGKKPQVRVLGGGAIEPSKEELQANPRSHSAKLRVVEKL